MSTKLEPLLSDEQVMYPDDFGAPLGPLDVRDIYESARAKDAEMIQRLVDALVSLSKGAFTFSSISSIKPKPHWLEKGLSDCDSALDAAAAAGFKPSEQ